MTKYYALEGRETVPVPDVVEWAERGAVQTVAKTQIGEVNVSTVFLGIDHNFWGDGSPLLFETMIFGGEHNEFQVRCSTLDDAEAQHQRACDMVKRQIQ